MQHRTFTYLFCLQALFVWLGSAVTHRTANVGIWNNTPRPIYGISVIHKYSDVYKNNKTWDSVPANSKSTTTFQVDYNTGFGTTGVDWWLASWFVAPTQGGGAFAYYYTAPQNFRSVWDFYEETGLAAFIIQLVVNLRAEGASKAADAFVEKVLNTEPTNGFKQCFLTSDDEAATTWIRINNDGTASIIPGSSSPCDTTVASKYMVLPSSPTPKPSSICKPNPRGGPPRCMDIRAVKTQAAKTQAARPPVKTQRAWLWW